MDAAEVAVEALRTLKAQCGEGHRSFPHLYHAILDGFAVHDDPFAREMLKAAIADGCEFEEYYNKLSSPHGFYFGESLAGRGTFDSTASVVLDVILDDNGVPKFGLPEYSINDEDSGSGNILLRIIYEAMEKHSHPLRPVRGSIRIEPAPLSGLPMICVANTCFSEAPKETFTPISEDRSDVFRHTLEVIKRGDFKGAIVNRRSVFLTTQLGIELIINLIGGKGSPSADEYMPPAWFQQQTGIPATRLRKAAERGQLPTVGAKKQTRYHVPTAKKLWPQDFVGNGP